MGIFDALTTAVAGLQAQSFALQNISGNVANSETTGYKETDTTFADLVSAASLDQQTTNGVIASSVATNTVQGTIQSTTVSTDMAINGSGFFVVSQPSSTSDNQPVFSSVNDYTRAGDFQMNSSGYLVNGAGYYLMGIPVDPTTGNPVGSAPQVLQFNNRFSPAQATSAITYNVNLPSTPTSGQMCAEQLCQQSSRGGGNHRCRRHGLAGCCGSRHRNRRQPDQRDTAVGRFWPRNYQRRQNRDQRRDQYDQLHGDRVVYGRRPDQRHQRRRRPGDGHSEQRQSEAHRQQRHRRGLDH